MYIEPEVVGDLLYIEPLYTDQKSNYWDWLADNYNCNGIRTDFEIQIPDYVENIRIFCNIGNITLKDVKAKIYTITNIGSISANNIVPLDISEFYVNIGKSIFLELNSAENLKKLVTGTIMGKIKIDFPKLEYDLKESSKIKGEIEEIYTGESANITSYFRHKGKKSETFRVEMTEKVNIITTPNESLSSIYINEL